MKRNGFVRGMLVGAAVTVAIGMMMGQMASMSALDKDDDKYFVTAGGQNNANARLWKKPKNTEELVYLGQFNPVVRGGQ